MSGARPEDREKERRYTLSIDEEDRQRSFVMEDERWTRESQVRDWLKLALLIGLSLVYHLLVYFLEPGLR